MWLWGSPHLRLTGWCMCDHNPTAVAHPYHTVLQVLPLLSQAAVGLYMQVGRQQRLRKRTQQQCDYKPQGEARETWACAQFHLQHVSLWGTLCRIYQVGSDPLNLGSIPGSATEIPLVPWNIPADKATIIWSLNPGSSLLPSALDRLRTPSS